MCETIAIVWDNGAEKSANKAVNQLRKVGKKAAYALIPGQPDDLSEEVLKAVVDSTHECAIMGTSFSDCFRRSFNDL